jgi:hypothetical protein
LLLVLLLLLLLLLLLPLVFPLVLPLLPLLLLLLLLLPPLLLLPLLLLMLLPQLLLQLRFLLQREMGAVLIRQPSIPAVGQAGKAQCCSIQRNYCGQKLSPPPLLTVLSFTPWLVVGVHRQSHRSSIVDPLIVTPRTNSCRVPFVVNAKCNTCSPIVVSFRPPW